VERNSIYLGLGLGLGLAIWSRLGLRLGFGLRFFGLFDQYYFELLLLHNIFYESRGRDPYNFVHC